MKILIFAGGHGTRLWPLSRKNSPKQFSKFFDGKSTLQLAFERVVAITKPEDIYVSTNEQFAEIVKSQLPDLPEENIFLEPAKRDLAPAVGLSFMRLRSQGYNGPVAILWSDHVMDNTQNFQNALQSAEQLILKDPNRFVYLGEKPRFANHNLGWITVGEKVGEQDKFEIFEFKDWNYRPKLEKCEKLFESGKSFWNPGYFVSSIDFVLSLYKKHKPAMLEQLEEITSNPDKLPEIYPTLESISFDDAIVEQTDTSQAIVLKVDLGWSDPGTLYALKEALENHPDDVVSKGRVFNLDSKDTLVYNENESQIVTTIGLDGFVVINTPDAVFIAHKNDIPKIKDMLSKMEAEGLDNYL